MLNTYNFVRILLLYVFYICSDVLAEICNDGTRCSRGRCCETGCCYDDDNDDRRYTYGYRLSIWNMWYFWFVILFLMMSCFGGCGYYKHRQRLIGGEPMRGQRGFFSILVQSHRERGRDTRRVLTPQNSGYPDHLGYYYGRYPDTNLEASMAPPPYTEVVSNPDLFPPSVKTGMPEDTGAENRPPGNEPSNQMPQPPPYTEVANQSTTGIGAANQDVQNQRAATNQGTEGNQ